MIFLQSLTDAEVIAGSAAAGGLAALGVAAMIFLILLVAAVYIYSSFAYMAIARKGRYPSPGIAWIPAVGPLIITSSLAKMHWWPILLLIGVWIPVLGVVLGIAVAVFSIIWHWKTYEMLGKPGWWAIFNIIQPVGLVFLGIVAWSKK